MSGVSSLSNLSNVQAADAGARVETLRPASEVGARQQLPDASEYSLHRIPKESLAKMAYYRPRTQQAPSLAGAALSAARAVAEQQSVSRAGEASPAASQPYTGCKTCQERVYQDGSDDAGVSFQGAKHIPSATAAITVASHEGEHVTRETDKAHREGKTITNKTVTLQFACCPECHKMYVAGGETSITTMADQSGSLDTGTALEADPSGENVDTGV